jgi:uncharacterized protein YjiS (DUF1127 family)
MFAFRNLVAVRRYFQARRDLERLEDLPDHMLRDMGFTRSSIRFARRQPLHSHHE